MTNAEMKTILVKNDVAEEGFEKFAEKFDAEKISEIVEKAANQKEAMDALHALYPELEIEKLQKQMDFVQNQLETAMNEQNKDETVELTEEELENVAGGNVVGDFFKNNWKSILIGAAIVVGCVAVGALLGFGGGLVGGVIAWGGSTFGVAGSLSTLAASGLTAMGLTGVTTATMIGLGVGIGLGAAAGGTAVGVLAAQGKL